MVCWIIGKIIIKQRFIVVENIPKFIKEKRTKENLRKRNPTWSRDELILALDLYFDCYPSIPSSSNSKIIELSTILNKINTQIKEDDINIRTPDSVIMKLSNFLRLDPRYTGKGLSKGSKLENVVWERFSKDIKKLKQLATQIKTLLFSKEHITTLIDIDEDEEFEEGKILTKLHKKRERNQKLIKTKKSQVLNKTGKLVCEICNFDFEKKYGKLGKGYIECHHNKPVSTLNKNETIKLLDLSILCSNCHRMIHRIKPWKSVAEMKEIIENS